MKNCWLLLLSLLLFSTALQAQEEQIPDRFITHKVKKKETLYELSQLYSVTIAQIKAYNPAVDKVGLKRRMMLRIPVFEK